MEKLKVTPNNFIYNNCSEINEFWQKGLETCNEVSDLISESILLYTFSYIGNKNISAAEHVRSTPNAALIIKKYIDDNFSSVDFSLEAISNELCYNKKYISAVFKKHMGIGIVEYLNTIRIQHACTLINQGFTGVSDIAACCGYADPQYFSKVFKQRTGESPSSYKRSL